MYKDLILLGSTGSIGISTLNVIKKNKKKIKIHLLSTNRNIKKIYEQAVEFNVKKIIIYEASDFHKYSHLFKKKKLKFSHQYLTRCQNIKKKFISLLVPYPALMG